MSTATAQLYETDFYAWIQRQADALRTRNISGLDFENLIEEIESMGRREKCELESRIEALLVHFLKWQHQPSFRTKSWQLTIEEQRRRIADHLNENPSLKSKIPETIESAYHYAIYGAIRETGLAKATFPAQCSWTFEQAMDPDFWPDA